MLKTQICVTRPQCVKTLLSLLPMPELEQKPLEYEYIYIYISYLWNFAWKDTPHTLLLYSRVLTRSAIFWRPYVWVSYVQGEDKCMLALVKKPEEGGTPRGPAHIWVGNLKWTLKSWDGRLRTGFIWIKMGISGELLWSPHLTHCGRVRQICVFNTVKLGTSASSP